MPVFKIPLLRPRGIPARVGRELCRDPSQGAAEGSPSAPLLPGDSFHPWVLTGLFRQFVLLIYFIIHCRPREGEQVLFYSERGDVAINAVTATSTFRVFLPRQVALQP